MAETDLEKRSELALKAADDKITAAGAAYSQGPDLKLFEQLVSSSGDLVQLSLKSLKDSGKHARKSKYFKRAEMKLRSLLRRLDSLEKEVAIDDRPPVEQVKKLVSDSHDQVLNDIMSKR